MSAALGLRTALRASTSAASSLRDSGAACGARDAAAPPPALPAAAGRANVPCLYFFAAGEAPPSPPRGRLAPALAGAPSRSTFALAPAPPPPPAGANRFVRFSLRRPELPWPLLALVFAMLAANAAWRGVSAVHSQAGLACKGAPAPK